MQFVTLNNGIQMPMEGYGVFRIADAVQCKEAVYAAIRTGYRLIDTAAAYLNEAAVGRAIARAIDEKIVTRQELFVTTKVWVQDMTDEESAYKAVKTSLGKLKLDHVDLVLLHQPMNDYFAAYRGLERAYAEGLTRSIGVANFYPEVLANFCGCVKVCPAVNQIEIHPFFARAAAIADMQRYGVHPQAWGPLAEGQHGIFTDPLLTQIGSQYGKTPAQVALRWNVQRGVSVIPKSSRPERMAENLHIWDFALTSEEIAQISAKTQGRSTIINHRDPQLVRTLLGWKVHE